MANGQFGLSEIPGLSMDYPRTRAGHTGSLQVTGSSMEPEHRKQSVKCNRIILEPEHRKRSVRTVRDTRIIHGLAQN